jgi:sugar lactone lactonase YvrE
MRYDELTGAVAPADGQTGATFVPSHGGGLSTPLDVLFTPDGSLLVDSAEDGSVKSYDGAAGTYQFDFVQRSGALFLPTGMIFSSDHTQFFVAALGTNSILRYDYDGHMGSNQTVFISDSALNGPAGMVFGPDGNLYITSLNDSSVLRYDGMTGSPLPGPGQTGATFIPSHSGGLGRAGGVVFGPDGNLFVSSEGTNEVMRYDGGTGDPLPADGQSGAVFVPNDPANPHLNQPAGMVFGPDGNLYVVSINTDSVIRFDGLTGDYIDDFISSGSGGLFRPRDLAFGSTDPSNLNYVTGAYQFAITTSATAPQVAGTPFDVTVTVQDSNGNPDAGYRGIIAFSSADPYGASLPMAYTFTAADAGSHTFPAGATLYTAGTWDVTATDAAGITASASVNVLAAAANGFQVIAPPGISSGTPFDVTLVAVDPYGNTDTNYTGMVSWTTSDPDQRVMLPDDYTFSQSNAGMVTFPNGATLFTPGDQTITATDSASGIMGSATITVTGGPQPGPGGRTGSELRTALVRNAAIDRVFRAPDGRQDDMAWLPLSDMLILSHRRGVLDAATSQVAHGLSW